MPTVKYKCMDSGKMKTKSFTIMRSEKRKPLSLQKQ